MDRELLRKELLRLGAAEEEPLMQHTTFHVGGPAEWFFSPRGEGELLELLAYLRSEGVPHVILGNGSNVLVHDDGVRGAVIQIGPGLSDVDMEKLPDGRTLIRAGAGILLSALAKRAWKESLTGFEFAAGIPGSLGGAVVMNAGAYGGEMKQVLTGARVLTKEGEILELPAEELDLSYRHSCIPEREYIVLSATLVLSPGNYDEISGTIEDLARRRREKQPLEYPSAGSTFKRPEGYFAGKLIEDAGLRGYRVGGAQVSEKHCGFVINRDHATCADITRLMKDVQDSVMEKFGVHLEPEVKFLGGSGEDLA